MGPRGIPWDDLSVFRDRSYGGVIERPPAPTPVDDGTASSQEQLPRDLYKDADAIGRRILFGGICGSLTGACFGSVDILRDTKAMTARKNVATTKLLRYTGLFGGFFASYHGIRKTLMLYVPQPVENNVILSSVICITPLVAVPTLRPLIPYSIMLIGLDAINGLD
jgi:hypothetical protein